MTMRHKANRRSIGRKGIENRLGSVSRNGLRERGAGGGPAAAEYRKIRLRYKYRRYGGVGTVEFQREQDWEEIGGQFALKPWQQESDKALDLAVFHIIQLSDNRLALRPKICEPSAVV